MKAFVVVYRPHDRLHCDTQYFGPFPLFWDAEDFLASLPVLGIDFNGDMPGVKYIQELTPPSTTASYRTHLAMAGIT